MRVGQETESGSALATGFKPPRDNLATMKALRLLLLGCVLCAARLPGQTYLTPLDGSLIDCGQEKVVVAESTASADRHFAAAWTIRPKGGKPAVDWSGHERDDAFTWIKKYKLNSNPTEDADDLDKSDYVLLNGVVDLADKVFTPLSTDAPYFPYKTHGSLNAVWSEDRQGSRYAAVGNIVGSNHTENTINLWLASTRRADSCRKASPCARCPWTTTRPR